MEPERMVEAREHQRGIENKAAVGDQRRVEQGKIRGVGEHALMQREVVAELARRLDPHLLACRAVLWRQVTRDIDRPDLDRTFALPIGSDLRWQPVDELRLELR